MEGLLSKEYLLKFNIMIIKMYSLQTQDKIYYL